MDKLFERYFNDFINLFPTTNDMLKMKKYENKSHLFENSISVEHINKQKDFFRKYKTKLEGKKEKSNYHKLLFFKISRSLKEFQFNLQFLPLNHMENFISFFSEMASGATLFKFKTKKDYNNFIIKANNFTNLIDTCIVNMEEGIKREMVLSKLLCNLLIRQLESIVSNKSYTNKKIKVKLDYDFNKEIDAILKPKIKKLLIFLKKVYLPKCVVKVGLCNIKNGRKLYEFLAEEFTTLDNINILEIHNYGISEVKRIHNEMIDLKNKLNFKGTLGQFNKKLNNDPKLKFKNETDLIEYYELEQKRILDHVMKDMFDIKISHNYLIKKVPKYNQSFAPSAYYMPGSLNFKRKGTFYINTGNIKSMTKMDVESLSLHEGLPGHHFQLTYLYDNDFPLFIKIMNLTGYEEGWGLYSENLGIYSDPLSYYGKLNMEMMRAIRLVVDTGLHYYDWGEQKSIDYFKKYTFMDLKDIESEVHRYIAIPGQALSYKMGEKVFLDLRKKYKNMPIKEFHNRVVKLGPMPLSVLKKIDLNA
jgi:uncharacterized protein (DUF885 family)